MASKPIAKRWRPSCGIITRRACRLARSKSKRCSTQVRWRCLSCRKFPPPLAGGGGPRAAWWKGRPPSARIRSPPSPFHGGGMSRLPRFELHVNVFFLRVSQHLLPAFLAPDAGLLVAAKWRAEEMLRYFVDPDEARLHRCGGAVRGGEIVGPDRSGEPVFDRIHLFEHFCFVAPFADGKDGAEDFLPRDAHVRLHVGKHRWFDEEAVGERRIGRSAAAIQQPRAFLLA